ncbi:MAG: diguanylate cyclase, partial [Sedimenticola sp.]
LVIGSKPASMPASEQPLIYLLEDDRQFAEGLALQLGNYGYRIELFTETSSIERAIAEQAPSLLIADIMLDPSDLSGPDLIEKLRRTGDLDIPIIIYSVRGDFEARLSAVRASADAYFVKPIETDLLVDKVDSLLGRKPTKPYQVLLIDDDFALAKHYALVLTHAEINVRVVTQPSTVLTALEDFRPDLIIMDLYMPECSGFELAKVIRHQPQFDIIPIIFLSTEYDVDKQLMAMRMGGDEFITKPIEDQHLLASVLIRAERSRLLSDLAMNDSLTGLLKHAKMKEQLKTEVAHSSRTNARFAFVMFDIDHFKKINDTYGHLTGDKVIKSLAQLLRKRLRSSDMIARFGGEEFATILHDCSPENALTLIDSIRENFQQLVHHSGEHQFHATFSAGIALFPGFSSAESLNKAADEALYRAKEAGRNQVVLNQ